MRHTSCITLPTKFPQIETVQRSVNAISQVLFTKNHALTSDVLDDIQNYAAGNVPWHTARLWNNGNCPEDPKHFFQELIRKRCKLIQWEELIITRKFWQSTIALGDCFYPSTFLKALRQHSARVLNTTIEQLHLQCSWNDLQSSAGNSPILNVSGLLLQGSKFDGKMVTEVSSSDPNLCHVPPCQIYYVANQAANVSKTVSVQVPVYYSLDRSKEVFQIKLSLKSFANEKGEDIESIQTTLNLKGLGFILTGLY